jgi:hypothetical protein
MDRIGLLAAAVAVIAFPGGAFAAAAGLMAAAGSNDLRRAGEPDTAWTPATVAGLAALAMAAALVPLPGSPALTLPSLGAPGNLLAIIVLVAAAVVLCDGAPDRWDPLRLAAAAGCVVAVTTLCAAAASFNPDIVAGLGGGRAGAARLLTGASLLLAIPSLVGAGGRPRAPAYAVVGVVAALGVAVGEPSALASTAGVVSAAAALAAAAAAGGAGALLPGRLREILAVAAAATATVLAATLL